MAVFYAFLGSICCGVVLALIVLGIGLWLILTEPKI